MCLCSTCWPPYRLPVQVRVGYDVTVVYTRLALTTVHPLIQFCLMRRSQQVFNPVRNTRRVLRFDFAAGGACEVVGV